VFETNSQQIIEHGLMHPEGIAVDWLSRNIYWSDLARNRIEVARLNGAHRRAILWSEVDSPKSIALHPAKVRYNCCTVDQSSFNFMLLELGVTAFVLIIVGLALLCLMETVQSNNRKSCIGWNSKICIYRAWYRPS
jgi:hypothetical protein